MSDYEREIHGGNSFDGPSDGEVLAETREAIAAIENGDLTGVAPWSTKEETLTLLRADEARLMARI
jgi:hypothetical protein